MTLRKTSRLRVGWLGVAVAVCLGWLGGAAQAHHIRGIPHYTYSEHYPDAPIVEEVRQIDDLTLTMTYYEIPGTPAIDLSLYIKDNATGKWYEGDVIFAIYARDEDPAAAHAVTALRNPNNLYKVGWTYETEGLYWVRVSFDVDGKTITEIFKLQMGDSNVNYWLLGSVGGGVVLLIVVVAVIKRVSAGKAGAGGQPADEADGGQ